MKVLTKDVAAGTPVEFKFDASGSRFLIKISPAARFRVKSWMQ